MPLKQTYRMGISRTISLLSFGRTILATAGLCYHANTKHGG